MIEIPDLVCRMIVHPGSNKVLTTVSENGEPHSIVCSSLHVVGSDMIAVGDVFMKRTNLNLMNNGVAEVLVWHGKHGFSIKAKVCERLTSGPIFDDMKKSLDKYNFETRAVWTLKATEIWEESATDLAGTKVL